MISEAGALKDLGIIVGSSYIRFYLHSRRERSSSPFFVRIINFRHDDQDSVMVLLNKNDESVSLELQQYLNFD